MSPSFLADIGGSNSRFALANSGGRPDHIRIIENDKVASLEQAVEDYLRAAAARPRTATLAIAGPIDGDEIALTNRTWRFRRDEFARCFGFTQLRIVNDFEAIAWALLRLEPADVRPLGKPIPARTGVRIALGPGTGLGVAALVPVEGRWHVVASEGGHACFGPQASDEFEAFARLAAECGRVSAECILSGPGLVRLARALHPQHTWGAPKEIVARALARERPAQAVAQMFVRLLGRFAGGLALTFKAAGGVYITGGVATAFGPLLDDPQFRTAFEAHAPHEKLLTAIPTLLMTCAEPGLIGCAALADELAPA